MDFFQARYFSAAQQRFLSPDPMNAGVDLLHPQSWNAYVYVNNSPLSNTDPSGLGDPLGMRVDNATPGAGSTNSGGGSGRSGGGFTIWQSSNDPPAALTIGPANRPYSNGPLDVFIGGAKQFASDYSRPGAERQCVPTSIGPTMVATTQHATSASWR